MSQRPDAEEAAQLQYETEHTSPSRGGKSVVPYMIILIAVAFVLLIVAYFTQQRTAESVQGLNQSVNSFRTIDQLVDDNRALHEEVAQLQGELADAKDQNAALENQLDQLQQELAQTQEQLAVFLPPEASAEPSAQP